MSYDQRFSNAGDVFRIAQGTPGRDFGSTADIPGEGEPFESRRLSASLNYEFGSNDFFVRASSDEEDYESANALERRQSSLVLGVSRRLGSNWRVSADGRLSRSDYRSVDRDDDDVSADLRVSRQLTRTTYLDFGYRYFDRSSNNALDNYTENQYSLTLRFDPD